jgi:uncharacterized protein (TIGR03086 family)
MTSHHESVVVLSRALDQAGDVLAAVHPDQLGLPTPCEGWDVAHLVGHLVAAPVNFLRMAHGEEVDFSAAPEPAESNGAGDFRSHADDLIHHWHQVGDPDDPGQVDWQTAEIAVHTWDVATATGQSPQLDDEVAQRALTLMSRMLTPENRGQAFAPAVTVPQDAPIHVRLAAYAGRDVARADA